MKKPFKKTLRKRSWLFRTKNYSTIYKTTLFTGVTTMINAFETKEVIEIYADINPRFLRAI